MKDQQKSRAKTDAIVARAIDDADYREALLADPRGAIREAFGKELPLGVDVRVLEESSNVVYLVLPPKAAPELSDDDLQAVAAGHGVMSQRPRIPATGWFPLDEWLATVKM